MSININCVSDKPEFINYFSENIILPERAELTLVKSNMDIPFVKLVAVKVPEIAVADRGNTCFIVSIDGITEAITWTDLYNAHADLSNYDTDHGITANEYFNGQYEYLPNYPCVYTIRDPGPPVDFIYRRKLNFMEVVANAISLKYEFYDVNNEPEYLGVDSSLVFPDRLVGVSLPDGTTSVADRIVNGIHTSNKLVSTYAPQKRINNTLTVASFDAADNNNFAISAGNNTLTSTNSGINQAWAGSDNLVDINGGWWQTTFNYGGTGKAVYGISLVGVGHGADQFNPIAATYEPEVFDVGFEFDIDGAKQVYRIIDGQNNNTTPVTSHYSPANAKLEFNNNDRFFIQIQRGNLYSDTNEFIINLYQGFRTHDLSVTEFTKLIYTAKRTLNNPSIRPNIGFMSEADAGHIFSENSFVARTAQTDKQGDHVNIGQGEYYAGSFSIMPVITELTTPATDEGKLVGRSLWSAYGFSTLGVPVPAGATDLPGRDFTSINGVNQTLTLTRKTNFTTHNSVVRYHLGATALEDLFTYNLGFGVILNMNTGLSDLPKEFKVAIRSLPVKSFNGSYLLQSTAAAEERVIGTIPLPPIDEDLDVSIPIVYEPFNLLYRPLNNVNPFSTNKLDIEIFFHDFQTNLRKSFTTVNGHLTLEINARQGAKDPALKNNLRPV